MKKKIMSKIVQLRVFKHFVAFCEQFLEFYKKKLNYLITFLFSKLHGFSIWLNPFVMMINFGTTQN
jgi:hypothetical protein